MSNNLKYKVILYKVNTSKIFGVGEETLYTIENIQHRLLEDTIYDIHKILLTNKLAGKISGNFKIKIFEETKFYREIDIVV